jgi:epoxyqueuosine reductase|tara:strand:+ start:345 stop:1268 length:924 start_codon:yes stop_codon:yes gene_type:complete
MKSHRDLVKEIALDLGFSYCGISKADFLSDEAKHLDTWLKRGYQGKMDYLERHFDKRLDPRKLVPGAQSVISLLYNYAPKKDVTDKVPYKIARYAYGRDYHFVIKDKLVQFMDRMKVSIGNIEGRVFVDSAPVHERAWASKSGLGWVGKNTLLINKDAGSYFFLAELILDLKLESDGPIKDYCGTCTKCMDACPTDAIAESYIVDGSRCISYLTIELKDEIPTEFQNKMEGWTFGCDICQEVCPWNRFSQPHKEPQFAPQGWEELSKIEWEEMTAAVFDNVFKKSPVNRTKFKGLKRNISFIQTADR